MLQQHDVWHARSAQSTLPNLTQRLLLQGTALQHQHCIDADRHCRLVQTAPLPDSLRTTFAAVSAQCSIEVRMPGNQACACRSSSLTEGTLLVSAGLLPHTPPVQSVQACSPSELLLAAPETFIGVQEGICMSSAACAALRYIRHHSLYSVSLHISCVLK